MPAMLPNNIPRTVTLNHYVPNNKKHVMISTSYLQISEMCKGTKAGISEVVGTLIYAASIGSRQRSQCKILRHHLRDSDVKTATTVTKLFLYNGVVSEACTDNFTNYSKHERLFTNV